MPDCLEGILGDLTVPVEAGKQMGMARRLLPVPYLIFGGPWGTVPELLFEKKGLITAVQQLLVSYHT
jgi:hypothetical protein